MKKSIIVVLIVFPFFMGNKCSDQQNGSNKKASSIPLVIVDTTFNFATNFSQYTITEATLHDSILSLTIQATVCKDTPIDLVFNGNYLKSYPPKAQVGLRFEVNSKCKDKITITKNYNVSSIKYPHAKSLVILLPNKQSVTYSY